MSKRVSWDLYSKRRHITLQSLVDAGKVVSYDSYIDYCNRLEVHPVDATRFTSEVTFKISSVEENAAVVSEIETQSVADTAVEASLEVSKDEALVDAAQTATLTSSVPEISVTSNISDEPQTAPLVATVWLAGVADDAIPSSNISSLLPKKQEDVRFKTKKKKNKG